jgi:DNA-binding NarL/FixJ family response regulator
MGAHDGSRGALEERIARITDFTLLARDPRRLHTADVALVAVDRDEFGLTWRIASRAVVARPPVLLVVDEPFEELTSVLRLGVRGVVLSSATDRELADCAALVARHCTVVPEALLGDERPGSRRRAWERTPRPASRATLEGLSRREVEVLKLIGSGRNNTEIAGSLWLSSNTVRSHVRRLMRKLGMRNRVCLIILAHELGLVDPGDVVLSGAGAGAVPEPRPHGAGARAGSRPRRAGGDLTGGTCAAPWPGAPDGGGPGG